MDNLMTEIDLEGCQVVNSQYFSTMNEPQMTIWCDSVSFSQAAYTQLNNCEAISIMLNKDKKQILISPIQSSNGNAIVWRKGKNVTKYCKISCTTFARKLFDDWGLDDTYRYRTIGRMVQSDKKVMVLFDFSQAEKWKGDKAVK